MLFFVKLAGYHYTIEKNLYLERGMNGRVLGTNGRDRLLWDFFHCGIMKLT